MGTAKRARQKANRQQKLAQEAKQHKREQVVTKGRRIVYWIVGFVVVALIFVFIINRNSDDDGDTAATTTTTTVAGATTTVADAGFPYGTTPCPPAAGVTEPQRSFEDAFERCIDPAKSYAARVTTSVGTIVVDLDVKGAPGAVNNFVALARSKYYDGLTFHRLVTDFVVQGGDPEGTGLGGPGYQFPDELPRGAAADPDSDDFAYRKGTVAMANAGANTNGSQFFIVLTDGGGKGLTANYSVLGRVADGMDVVDDINALDTAPAGRDTKPAEALTIESVEIIEA